MHSKPIQKVRTRSQKLCYENSAVYNIIHLRCKKAYTKFVLLYYSQGGPGAPAVQRARTGPVLVLCTVQVRVLYSYFRVPVPVRVLYMHFKASSFKVYNFRVKMQYIMNCRVITFCQNTSCKCIIIHVCGAQGCTRWHTGNVCVVRMPIDA